MEKIIAGLMLLGTVSGTGVVNADVMSESKSSLNVQDTYKIESDLFELDSVYSNDKIDK